MCISVEKIEGIPIRKGWKSLSAVFITWITNFVLVLSSISLLPTGKKQSAFEPEVLPIKGIEIALLSRVAERINALKIV